MADIILSFRDTSTYVTDAVGTYVLGTDTYPVTRGGFTFGWTSGVKAIDRESVDRDSAVSDKRFAGINYALATGVSSLFRVDLPATGTYDVRLANGDTAFGQTGQRQVLEIFDNATSKLVIDKATGPAQDHYFDATGVDRTEAAWPGSNAPASITFASTIFILKLANGSIPSGNTVLAHLQITTAASETPITVTPTTDSLAGGEIV